MYLYRALVLTASPPNPILFLKSNSGSAYGTGNCDILEKIWILSSLYGSDADTIFLLGYN
jgi:hypothetical protein